MKLLCRYAISLSEHPLNFILKCQVATFTGVNKQHTLRLINSFKAI